MVRVMAVSFEEYGHLHYLDPGDETYRVGDLVLFPTDSGPEVARCVWAAEEVESVALGDLPRCAGRASEADLARDQANRAVRAEAELVAKSWIEHHQLPMKVVGVDFVDRAVEFDQQVVIYFTAPGRVDFRALLSDLARSLRSRIDLRQVASRDAARLIGGIGQCGRDLCCATFLTTFEPISSRLARAQDLPSNPLQISGACGRLLCCLAYEYPMNVEFLREAPEIGSTVTTPNGEAKVIGYSVPAQSLTVRSATGEVTRCPRADACQTAPRRKPEGPTFVGGIT
ncbi:MAG TPA: regulatory iron-sulfur-containing complex subunit RicT [Propionibacteriaceae bacterium]|nr:regulatory iron-sulfur-containing complex subunit RicT [Propionibacteriaceae bacterium]